MLIDICPAGVQHAAEAASSEGRPSLKPVHVPAAGLVGSGLADRFCFWRGRSGRRYVFSVYRLAAPADLDAVPRYADAVVMIARRNAEGARTIVALGDSGPFPEFTPVIAAVARGEYAGDELHVHLLANGGRARRAVLDDLAAAGRHG